MMITDIQAIPEINSQDGKARKTSAVLSSPNPRAVSAAAGALSWLLDDSSMREAMGQAARRRAVAEFTYDTLAHQLVRAIEEAVHRQ